MLVKLMQHVWYPICLVCNMSWCNMSCMQHVWYAICLVCNMSGMQYVWYAICLVCNMSGMQYVWYAICLVCNMSGIQYVWYAKCLVCNMSGIFFCIFILFGERFALMSKVWELIKKFKPAGRRDGLRPLFSFFLFMVRKRSILCLFFK